MIQIEIYLCFIFEERIFLFPLDFREGAAAGFVDFGNNPYETAKEELSTEFGIISSSNLEKSLSILPFIKNGYPQPLFIYGFIIDISKAKNEIPIFSSINEIKNFERNIKNNIKQGGEIQEAYPFAVRGDNADDIVNSIYQRDISQTGKNGGFFGPIFESYNIFRNYLKN